ncbi:MAG: hypothetical protein MK197_06345 [Candidatus Poseidoniaceae archaeon]|nr:hypothetical protein [Candidatus Poseidoniaceae archaeon]
MWTIEEFKRDTEKQILVAGIVFFLIAFPYYFDAVSDRALGTSSDVTGLYEVGGDTRLVELDSGMEYVASGETWTIDDLSTDSVDGASDMNIVGVLVTLSYGEDETTTGFCAPGPGQGQDAADTISGTVIHGPHNASASGNNAESPASHTVESIWYNDSMVGEVVLSSISEIEEQIDSNGAGLGAYSLDITVDAEAGDALGPTCQREDNGEEVSYKVELIVYDYVIVPFIELDDIE